MCKFSLLFAAAVMAFAMQTAWAEDVGDSADTQVREGDESGVVQRFDRGDRFRGSNRGPGRGQGMHRGRGGPDQGMGRGMGMERCPGMGMGMGMGMMGGHSDEGGFGPGRHGNILNPRVMEDLALTDAQKTKLAEVLAENYKNRLLARMELHDAFAKLRELNQSEQSSADAIIAANTALGTAQGKLSVLNRAVREQVRAVLTPEQIEKLDAQRERGDPRRNGLGEDRPSARSGRFGPDARGPRMQGGMQPRMNSRMQPGMRDRAPDWMRERMRERIQPDAQSEARPEAQSDVQDEVRAEVERGSRLCP